MAMQFSVTARNARLTAVSTTVAATPQLRFYTGALPANCATAASGTLLATLTLPATPFGTAAAGAMALAGTWSGTAANAGTAGYFRMLDSAGTNVHIQGTVTPAGAQWVTATAVVVNQYKSNASNLYQATTAGTTGATAPVHNSGSVSDGGVTWLYVSALGDMQIDNPTFTVGQTITDTSFTLTDANA